MVVTRGGKVVSTHDTIKAAVDARFDLKQAGKK
jgi:hypothetical protein